MVPTDLVLISECLPVLDVNEDVVAVGCRGDVEPVQVQVCALTEPVLQVQRQPVARV